MTHICVSKLTIISSANGLSPDRRQAIISINDGILLIEPIGTNFSEILIEIHTFSLKKIDLNISSGKRRTSCLGLNVLTRKFHSDAHMRDYHVSVECTLYFVIVGNYRSRRVMQIIPQKRFRIPQNARDKHLDIHTFHQNVNPLYAFLV